MKMKFLKKISLRGKFSLTFKNLILFLKNLSFLKLAVAAGVGAGVVIFILFYLENFFSTKPRWQIYLQKADNLYNMGKLKEAKKLYLDIREKFPSNPEMDRVNFQLGNTFHKLGFIHRACFFYEKVAFKNSSPYFFEARYNLALCYRKAGEFDKALKLAEEMIEKFPESEKIAEFYLIAADSLLENSKEKEAVSFYQRIIRSYPLTLSAQIAYLRLGNIFLSKNQYSEAALFYSHLIKDYPRSKLQEEALFNLSRCYIAQEKIEEALSFLFMLLERFPQSRFLPEGFFLCADVFLKKGEFARAREICEKILPFSGKNSAFAIKVKEKLAQSYEGEGKLKEAIKIYESILKQHPYIEDIYLRLGSLYLKEKEFVKAIRIFQAFVRYFPLSPDIFSAYLNLGIAFHREGIYSGAIKAFNNALRESSSREQKILVLSELANVCMKLELWGKAIDFLEQKISLLKKKEEKVKTQIKLVRCYLESGKLDVAKKNVSLILKSFPQNNLSQLFDVAHLFSLAGEEEVACSIYKKILQVFSGEEGKVALCLFKIAKIRQKQGKIKEAISLYEKIVGMLKEKSLKDFSEKENTLINLADLYYFIGEYKKAVKLYLEALTLYPKDESDAWLVYQIGNCYRHLDLVERAEKFYRDLNERFPESVWANLSQAML